MANNEWIADMPSVPEKLCSVEGCNRILLARSMCKYHYQKFSRSPIGKKEIAERPLQGPNGSYYRATIAPCIYADCIKMSVSTSIDRCELHKNVCMVPSCTRIPRGRHCPMHTHRLHDTGTVGDAVSKLGSDSAPKWKIDRDGYVYRHATIEGKGTRLFQHRVVMEQMLRRNLVAGENVHHKDLDRSNNDPSNLELWLTKQPTGARVEDLLPRYEEVLRRFKPELFK